MGQSSQFSPDFAKAQATAPKIIDIIEKKTLIDVDKPGIDNIDLKGDLEFKDVW
jgi:hypothetical protein